MTKNKNKCSVCKYWKNNQSELDYDKNSGFCTSHKLKFTTTNYSSAYLMDRQNRTEKHKAVNRFENVSNVVPIGEVERSRYRLVTDSDFGCINHLSN